MRVALLLIASASAFVAPSSRLAHTPTRRAATTDFRSLLDRYDGFLLDQFGVVHDGKACYAGSAEAARELQKLGKRVAILSNSSKRKQDTITRFSALTGCACTLLESADVVPGVPLFSAFTSGDLVHDALRDLQAPEPRPSSVELFQGLVRPGANRVVVLGNGVDDGDYVKAAGLIAAPVDDADFLLARGLFAVVDGPESTPLAFDGADACDALLAAAAARDLPMVVANPDLVRPDGAASPMPGVVAARYAEKFGGRCALVGKPHAAIYERALGALERAGVDRARVAAVGDSMHHDVAGAAAAGVDSVLVAGGVHAAELGVAQGAHEAVDADRLAAFLADFDAQPTHVVPGFTL